MTEPSEHKTTEADAILSRAIELQHASDDGPELGRADLEAIAQEMGIPQRYVQAALAEKRGDTAPKPETADPRFYLWGAPARFSLDARVEHTLDADACEDLIALAQQRVGRKGKVSRQGRGVTWEARRIQVALLPRGGQTRLWMSRRVGGTAVALFVPILVPLFLLMLGAAIPLGIVYGSVFLPIFGVVLGMALAFLAVRALYASIANTRRREFEALGEVLLDAARAPGKSSQGRTVLPAFDEEAVEVEEVAQVVAHR